MIAKIAVNDLTKAANVLARLNAAKRGKAEALRSIEVNSYYFVNDQVMAGQFAVAAEPDLAKRQGHLRFLKGELLVLATNFWDDIILAIESELREMGVEFESAIA